MLFAALADATRRGIVDRLAVGEATVTELAAPSPSASRRSPATLRCSSARRSSPEASKAGGGARDFPRCRSPGRRCGSRGTSGSGPRASAGSTTTSLDSPPSSRHPRPRPRPRPREVGDDHDDDPTARPYAHPRRAARARLPGIHGPRPPGGVVGSDRLFAAARRDRVRRAPRRSPAMDDGRGSRTHIRIHHHTGLT